MTLSLPISRPRLLILLLCALATPSPSQTLARPGWAGSGMNASPWWKHAIVYQANPTNFSTSDGTPLHGLAQRLDYIQSLGADAILLTSLSPPSTPQAIDPAYGTLDDLDDLIHQASRHNIRVLLELNPQTPDLASAARFWLNRGIAGFHPAPPELRKITNTFLGQRILIGDLNPSESATPDPPQLLLDPRPGTPAQLTAAAIRPALDASQQILNSGRTMPLLLTDGPAYPRSISRYGDGQHDLAIAKILSTLLLTTHSAAILYSGQELGLPTSETPTPIVWDAPRSKPAAPASPATPNAALEDADPSSLLNWYRQLSALHHSNPVINSGANITLNHDDQNVLAWVRKPQTISSISPAIVVICNLSAQPVQLSLKADIQALHLKGSFLRTVIRSDSASGPMHLESMTIAPYAVYIGELRF